MTRTRRVAGILVPNLIVPVDLVVHTKCPQKYLIIDIETSQFWTYDPYITRVGTCNQFREVRKSKFSILHVIMWIIKRNYKHIINKKASL